MASQEHSVGVLVVGPEGLDGSCTQRYSAVWPQDVNARFDDLGAESFDITTVAGGIALEAI